MIYDPLVRVLLGALAVAGMVAFAAPVAAKVVTGTSGDDNLKGTSKADEISGRGGDDVLRGVAGNDKLKGAAGADELKGSKGNDKIFGGGASDVLIGGKGKDKLDPGKGEDGVNMRDGVELASPGDDVIKARDGSMDQINCGDGKDRAFVDAEEEGVFDCESGERRRNPMKRGPPTTPTTSPRRARRRGELERLEAAQPRGDAPPPRLPRPHGGRSPARASLASVLPAGQLIAEAAQAAAKRKPPPAPKDLPIDTFVVLMMENRSFDHYFGWHPRRRRARTRPQLSRRDGDPGPDPPPRPPTSRAATSATPTTAGTAAAASGTAARTTASSPATRRATAATSSRSATT